MQERYIYIRGCRQHNLKNVDVKIPKNSFICITGVCGSGKSSLAFDTIFAEGQRRYMESLSPQVRTWLRQFPKPDADLIEGLSPTLAIGQGKSIVNPRSIVATQTDIYDFLAIIFSKLGKQYSPVTGRRLKRQSRQEIIESILHSYTEGQRLQLLVPIKVSKETLHSEVLRLQKMGFVRLRLDGEEFSFEDTIPQKKNVEQLDVVVDRIAMKEGIRERLSSSIMTALELGRGIVKVQEGKEGPVKFFTEIYVCPETGLSFAPLDIKDFRYTTSHGACPCCQGRGGGEVVDIEALPIDSGLSVGEQLIDFLAKFPRKKAHHYVALWESYLMTAQISENETPASLGPALTYEILTGSRMPITVMMKIEGEMHSAYHEHLYKLRKLPDRMHTPSARAIADERLRYLDDFFERLIAEWQGEQ